MDVENLNKESLKGMIKPKKTYVRLLRSLVFCSALSACAGPMTPFGSIDGLSDFLQIKDAIETQSNRAEDPVSISFLPDKQVLHDSFDLELVIVDQQNIPASYLLSIIYNGTEVTEKFILTHKKNMDSDILVDGDKLHLSFKNLKLLPHKKNEIVVQYQRAPGEKKIFARYMPPECKLYQENAIEKVGRFQASETTLQKIERLTKKQGLNAGFFAGLIAQESSFKSNAVSWAKAIGLTQVTPLAEQSIFEKNELNWPQYPGINEMSVPKIKALIYAGKINAGNEWRLSEEKSIMGGITFIKQIEAYWNKPDGHNLIMQTYPENSKQMLEDIILASYNSGPARVKNSIEVLGKDWMQARKLREARTYVGKVKSFCYHFSSRGDGA